MERDPRVTLEVIDYQDGYRSVEIRGRVTMTYEGAHEHINDLALKYTGEGFTYTDGQVRVKVIVEPERAIPHS